MKAPRFLDSLVKRLEPDTSGFWHSAFIFLTPVIAVIMIAVSRDYGITWDEWLENHYGYLVLRNVLTWGENQDYRMWAHVVQLKSALFHSLVNLFYGLFFTPLGEFMKNGLHQDTHILGLMNLSHTMNAACGFAAILITGFFARWAGSWRTAVLAMLFLFLSPRFFGNSMNNPKDIPFAAAYLFSIFSMCRFIRDWPKPKLSSCLGIAAGLALSIGIRSSGGLILIPYFLLFCALAYAHALIAKKPVIPFTKLALYGAVILAAGYLGGLIFWPYGRENIFLNPLNSLREMSRFETFEGTALFDGMLYPTNNLPWTYIPKWILISSPLYFVLGLCILIPASIYLLKKKDAGILFVLLFSAVFPVAYILYKESILYDSWRHLLFVYPPLIILTALAWEQLLDSLKTPFTKALTYFLLCVLLIEPSVWMVRNHPHQYVYFNALTGGLKGAYGNYETDYWGNCIRMGADWLGRQPIPRSSQNPVIVRANAQLMASYPFLRKAFGDAYQPLGHPPGFMQHVPQINITQGVLTSQEVMSRPDWHYAIVFSRDVPPSVLKSGQWPPAGTIHTIEADNVPLCAVVENPAVKSRS